MNSEFNNQEECFICLLDIDKNINTLPCGHKVHQECLDEYYKIDSVLRCKCGIKHEKMKCVIIPILNSLPIFEIQYVGRIKRYNFPTASP